MNAQALRTRRQREGTAALPDELFGQPVHEHLLWLSVKRHLGNQRQGTAMVKSEGPRLAAAAASRCKPEGHRQRALRAPNTSPLMPGGGRAFGPQAARLTAPSCPSSSAARRSSPRCRCEASGERGDGDRAHRSMDRAEDRGDVAGVLKSSASTASGRCSSSSEQDDERCGSRCRNTREPHARRSRTSSTPTTCSTASSCCSPPDRPRARAGGLRPMSTDPRSIVRKVLITEKGTVLRETQQPVLLRGGARRQQDRDQARRRGHLHT